MGTHLLKKATCSSKPIIRKNVSFLCFSAQVFFKPVIEDLRMELARKCTKLISDVSDFSDFFFSLCVCGTIMPSDHRVGEKTLQSLLKHNYFPDHGTKSRNFH